MKSSHIQIMSVTYRDLGKKEINQKSDVEGEVAVGPDKDEEEN